MKKQISKFELILCLAVFLVVSNSSASLSAQQTAEPQTDDVQTEEKYDDNLLDDSDEEETRASIQKPVSEETTQKPASTQEPVSGDEPAGDMELTDVLAKSLEAYGGDDALEALANNVQIFGKLIPPNSSSKSQTYYAYRKFRKDKRWRVDLEAPPNLSAKLPLKRVLAFNGLAGWRSVSDTVSDLNPIRLAQLNDDNECQPDILAKWGKDENYKFRLLGPTTFRQVPVYSVLITDNSGRDTTMFIDRRNFLIVGIKYKTRGTTEDNARVVTIEYSQYRPVGGTMFPHKHTRFINGRLASELQISSVLMTDPVQDSLFDRPQSAGKVRLSRPVHVKFDFISSEVLVKGRINNGEELVFLFDTGASDTIIDRRVAAEHFLAKQGKQGMMAISGRINADQTSIKRLELGNLIVNDLDARILSLASQSHQMGRRIAGIIGTNLIKKFVVKLDYGKSEITFYDTDTFKRPESANAVSFIQPNAPVVSVILNGRTKLPILVDTGAALNNLPTGVAREQLGGAAKQVSHSTEATGLDGKRIKLGNIVIDKVKIGNQIVRGTNFTYVQSDSKDGSAKSPSSGGKIVEEKGGFFKSKSIGILGNPFWKNFIVIVDYKFQRLLLTPNPVVRVKEKIEKLLEQADDSLFHRRDYRASEQLYQKALLVATTNKDTRYQAVLWGRLGNMRRMMAKDLARPEHTKTSYEYFIKAQNLAIECGATDVRGRILADWSLLYNDNGQIQESAKVINQALMLAPNDAQVNVDYAIHLSRQGQYSQMQKYVEKALFAQPSNWLALWLQFKLADKFLDYQKALNTLKEIRKYYPSSKLAVKKVAEVKAKMKAMPPVNPGQQPMLIPPPNMPR